VVTAAAPYVPRCLREQLAKSGRMVIPVSSGYNQELQLIERLTIPAGDATAGALAKEALDAEASDAADFRFRETSILACVFVPLIGQQGYPR
jgi:protein-L-isoaspartate O-methyltransferase